MAFYETVWGLEKRQQFNIKTDHSGLNSQVLCAPDTQLYFNINEPTSESSQIQTFIDIEGEVHEKYIPPLTIQMLVENAIKHNVISEVRPLKIHISHQNGYISIKNNLQISRS